MGNEEHSLDTGTHPVIFADEMMEATIIGENVRVKLCEKRLIDGEEHRVVVVELIRPIKSLRNPMQVLAMAGVPPAEVAALLH